MRSRSPAPNVSIYLLWARWWLGGRNDGPIEMRQAVRRLREQGVGLLLPFCLAMLAEMEMEAGEIEAGLASVDAAIAAALQTGEHWYLSECYRVRGHILLRHDPADAVGAAQALCSALLAAQQRSARSLALRAALALAELYGAMGRDGRAHAVLAPALEGFRPSRELPEIAKAHSLLAKLEAISI